MYDFRSLSPLDFEELVRDLIQAEMGLRLESFGSGRDLGIDFRFAHGQGNGVVQAKHFAESGAQALLRTVKKENQKVRKLAPTRYVLATSVQLTPAQKTKIRKVMPDAPLEEADILGKEDLNNLLGRHKEIERKHFKLWLTSTSVLERILHSGVYNRTQAELEVIRSIVPKFVQNDSVPQAEAILDANKALIIAGEPGVGKSTLARMLVWLHMEQEWNVSVIGDIAEAFEIVNEGGKRLIFFDDFLGQIRLSDDLVRGTDQRFPPFLQKVRSSKNLRFILTTRDYILRQAQYLSSRLSSPTVNASEFTLNVGHYTRAVRARILYNHIFFSGISPAERDALLQDDLYLKIIDHRNFNPRLIDLLTSADYVTLAGTPLPTLVLNMLENPQELWEKPYRTHISGEGRALMLALFFNEPRPALTALERSFDRMVKAMGLTIATVDLPPRFRSALKELEGSVLAIADRHVHFSNPGIRDYLQRAVAEDRFVPAAVGVATEYAEVKQCWAVFCGDDDQSFKGHALTQAWVGAGQRLLASDSGTPIRRLGLVVDMYDRLQAEELIDQVREAIRAVEADGIEGLDVGFCQHILEHLVSCLLPFNVQKEAQDIVTSAVAMMLIEFGESLTLDEIKTTTAALAAHGTNADAAWEAGAESLDRFVRNLDLHDFTSAEELADFHKEITEAMNEFGLDPSSARRVFEARARDLRWRDNSDDGGSYGSRGAYDQTSTSDDQIRSMFKSLRGA